MRINSEDRLPARVHARDKAPAPTGFAKIVGDDFPVSTRHILPSSVSAAATLPVNVNESRANNRTGLTVYFHGTIEPRV
jgi:hypothetical protein